MKRLLVVGAAGDVGRGIVQAAADLGWKVAAAGRSRAKLEAATGDRAAIVEGSVASEAEASALWDAASAALGGIDAVAVSVNGPNVQRPMLEWSPEELAGILNDNVISHFIAARTFLPRLGPDGMFVGIGGGMADFVMAKNGSTSMGQAALRNMYRALAKENKAGAALRELMVVSMVNGASKRAIAEPSWLTDVDIGQHLCAVVSSPASFPGPILTLKSREQVGQPDVAPA